MVAARLSFIQALLTGTVEHELVSVSLGQLAPGICTDNTCCNRWRTDAIVGAAAAVGLVLPELDGKLDGFAVRVPTINVSLVDLTFQAARDTTVEEINSILKAASDGPLKGVLAYNDGPLVSIDFKIDSNFKSPLM